MTSPTTVPTVTATAAPTVTPVAIVVPFELSLATVNNIVIDDITKTGMTLYNFAVAPLARK